MRKRVCIGLILVLLCFIHGYCRQNDSDIEWYEHFFSQTYSNTVEEALEDNNIRLNDALEIFDYKQVAKIHKESGLIHLTRTNDYEKAMDFFIKSLTIEDSLNFNDQLIFTYLCIARVFEEVGDFYKSADFIERALNINTDFHNVHIEVLLINKLGEINASLGKMDEAFKNFSHTLSYNKQIDPKFIAEAYFNLAHLHQLKGNFGEALKNFKDALVVQRSTRERANEALYLNDIGVLYLLMNNNERALANHVAALEIRQESKDKRGIAKSYNNIGALYYLQKNYERAIANLQLALQSAQESQAQHQIMESYKYLTQSYEQLGDYKKALEYQHLFLAINDFIQNELNERQLLETQNRYDINKKQTQIDRLELDRMQKEKELEEQEKFKKFLFVLIGLVLVIVLLILYMYLIKQRSNRILQAVNVRINQQNIELNDLNATKDKFFSIISHDIKGPLNSLSSFTYLLKEHIESMSKEDIQTLATDLDKSQKNLYALLENLLEWSRSQTGNIEFKPEPFDLGTVLEDNRALLLAQAQNKKIEILNKNNKECKIHAHQNSVNTVIRNLISNAIKFTPEGGEITLDLSQNDREVTVTIADNGVGMSKEVIQKLFRIDTKHSTKGTADEKGTGLGLILCKEFIEKNGGRIWVKSEEGKGSIFYFALPIM